MFDLSPSYFPRAYCSNQPTYEPAWGSFVWMNQYWYDHKAYANIACPLMYHQSHEIIPDKWYCSQLFCLKVIRNRKYSCDAVFSLLNPILYRGSILVSVLFLFVCVCWCVCVCLCVLVCLSLSLCLYNLSCQCTNEAQTWCGGRNR